MPDSYDVVIVGGAAMGSSIAYHLLADPGFCGRVLVIEKDPTYRRSASALSAASIRQQFSSAVNIRISLFGIAFLRRIGERLAVDGERPDVALRKAATSISRAPPAPRCSKRIMPCRASRAPTSSCSTLAALPGRFSWLNAADLACGTWGRSGEGWFDGWGLLQAYRRKARSLGAEYRNGRVVGLDRDGGRVTAARLADGTTIACGAVVNCAGAGGRALAAFAGIEIPVPAKRRSVFGFACGERLAGFPLLIDTTGVWCRPEGEGFIGGVSPAADEDPDWDDDDPATQEVDWSLLRGAGLAGARASRAGLRGDPPGPRLGRPLRHEPRRPQRHRRAGRRGLEPLSLQRLLRPRAAAIAGRRRGIAELIVHGRYTTLDLSDLGYERIRANRPLLERNVI